jgi:hypothetical protein
MPNSDPKSRWKSLAASLGVEGEPASTPEQEVAQTEAPESGLPAEPVQQVTQSTAPAPPSPSAPLPTTAAPKPKKKSHWSSLLGALGLESPQDKEEESTENVATAASEVAASASEARTEEP